MSTKYNIKYLLEDSNDQYDNSATKKDLEIIKSVIKQRLCWYCEARCVGLVAICKHCRSKNMKK